MQTRKKRTYDMSSRAASAQQTQERILSAVLDMFRAAEFQDVTFQRVAEQAGVSPQTVTLHFRTKEGLIMAWASWMASREEVSREETSGDPMAAAQKICARYEDLGQAMVRALALEDTVLALRPVLDIGRNAHREWVERTFGDQLGAGTARQRRVMELVAAYDVYTWHVLRRVLSAEDTMLAMAELARGVLAWKGPKR